MTDRHARVEVGINKERKTERKRWKQKGEEKKSKSMRVRMEAEHFSHLSATAIQSPLCVVTVIVIMQHLHANP